MKVDLSCQELRIQLKKLEAENEALRKEVEYLKMHPAIASGLKGETLIVKMVDGSVTKYAEEYDIKLENGTKIEVKYSSLHTPNVNYPNTKRWSWSKPLGWKDKGKDYDYLLLVGEKDNRYSDLYLGDAPYVFFVIPIDRISEIVVKGKSIGANVNLTTKLSTGWSGPKKVIIEHMVDPELIAALERSL